MLGKEGAENTKPLDKVLKRVDSQSSCVSSVPSEFVSYDVTPDHSYLASTPEDDAGDAQGMACMENQTASSAAGDATGEPKEEFRPPLKLTLKRLSRCEGAGDGAEEMQLDASSEPLPRRKKQRSGSGRKKRKSKAKSNGRAKEVKVTAGAKKQTSNNPDEESSPESGEPSEKKKAKRSSRYFEYILDDEDITVPTPVSIPRKQLFECVCGEGETSHNSRKPKHVVMCTVCGTSQHAECMHYNLENPFRGPYKCPHCHYVSIV